MTAGEYKVHDPEHRGLFVLSICALTVSIVVVIVRSRNFYFFSDDFLNFVIATDMGLSWKYLFRDVFGQFVPLYRLANSLYLHVFGLYFWPFRCLLILFELFAIGLLSRLAWKRNVGVIAMLPILTVLTFSPVFVTTYQWWSAALSVLSSAGASLACIFLVAEVEAPAFTIKLAVSACFLVGLLFYPKGLFTVILLLAIRLFLRASSGKPKLWPTLLGSLRDIWPTLVVVPIYLVIIHFGHYSSEVVRPDLVTLAHFVWIGWNLGFLTATLGLHYGSAGLVVTNMLVLGLLLWSVSRHFVNIILWAGFGLYFVISISVIGWNRAVPFGLESAEISRYYADILCFFLAILVIALGYPARSRKTFFSPGLAAIFATIFAAIELLKAGENVPHLWYAGAERPAAFVMNVRAALSASGEGLTIADEPVPDYIMPAWMSPLNNYGLFVRLFGWQGRIVEGAAAGGAFDQDGRLLVRH